MVCPTNAGINYRIPISKILTDWTTHSILKLSGGVL